MTTRSVDKATAKADRFILKNFKRMSNDELGDALGLSPHTVRRKMTELGLKRSRPLNGTGPKRATTRTMAAKVEKAEPIRSGRKEKTSAKVASSKKTDAVGSKRKEKTGTKVASSKKTDAVRSEGKKNGANADAFIRKSFKRMSNAEIGAALGLSQHTIRRKMTELGLKRAVLSSAPAKKTSVPRVKQARKANGAGAATKGQPSKAKAKASDPNQPSKATAKASDPNTFIRKSFKRMSNAEIGAALGLSPHTIRRKMTELGLKRPHA